ncbi:MRN complex-interacting protein [Hippocampus comes]|uniref:MRN complex-interacting protein n=1 Tax=Hippocampus comes TaxID=109280 RepID=UPI00094E162A|nr:PREDICTED: UPF0544 protein C5orf45 homolog [Hippocampus comes]
MSQTFHVVRCFLCDCFQVQQVKKVKKWTCKLCGEKQSLLKEFGGGSAADCRRHVQKLNAARGAVLEERDARSLRQQPEEETGSEDQRDGHVRGRPAQAGTHAHQQPLQPVSACPQAVRAQVSRWRRYMAAPEEKDRDVVPKDMPRSRGNSMTDRKRKREDRAQVEARVPSLGCDGAADPVVWPPPLLHPCSMFDSGEDFDTSL